MNCTGTGSFGKIEWGGMGDGYELVKYQLDERHVFWELKNSSHNQSELQKAMADHRLRESCRKLFKQVEKIIDYGVVASCQTGKLRCLDSEIGLYEIKGFDGVAREMAYIVCKDSAHIVLLRRFKGHQGSGNIHKEIELARDLAAKASVQLELLNKVK